MMVDDSALLHAQVYDPAKARAYYLRTRQLKGRGSSLPRVTIDRSSGSPRVEISKGSNNKKSDSSRNGSAEERLAQLKGRLERLKGLLEERVKQAKERSGIKVAEKQDTTTSPADKQKDAKGKSPATAKEKKDAAKRAKESYEKTKGSKGSTSDADVADEIQAVQKQIAEVQDQLKAAISRARKKAIDKPKSTTAPKGR